MFQRGIQFIDFCPEPAIEKVQKAIKHHFVEISSVCIYTMRINVNVIKVFYSASIRETVTLYIRL